MSSYQFMFGNLQQLFGKVLLKQILIFHSNFQNYYLQASHNNQSISSLSPSVSTTSITISSYPSSKTIITSLITASSISLLQHLVPELAPLNSAPMSSAFSKQQPHRSLSQVSILTPSSLHKHASTYSIPVIHNNSSAFSSSSSSTQTETMPTFAFSLTTNSSFFPGTCHRSAYLVFLPDPTSDLVLNYGPLIENTFKDYYDPDEDPEDTELEAFLNIYLFEEDEIEMERRKREKTFNWTITIPRPPDSIALPRPRLSPGQERERGKGWSHRRQSDWHGQGYYCLGGKPINVGVEYALRHWIASLNDKTSTLQDEAQYYVDVTYEWLRTETYETEPRIAALVRSINKLDALVT